MYISLIKLKNNFIMVLFSFFTGFLDYLTLGPAASIALQVQPSWKTLRYFEACEAYATLSLIWSSFKIINIITCVHQFFKYEFLCIKSLKREPVLPTASGELSNSQRQVKPRVLPFYQGQRGHSVLLLQIIMDLLLCSSCNNVINWS